MDKNNEEFKRQFIDAAILYQKNIAIDSKIANRQYDLLKKLTTKINNGVIGKEVLIDLLQHERPEVVACAATNMLILNYETEKAEQGLDRIVSEKHPNLLSFNAEMTLNLWRKKGKLLF
jgi:hypothetical protein